MRFTLVLTALACANAGFFSQGSVADLRAKFEKIGYDVTENGHLREDLFDSWSTPELKSWLEYHNIDFGKSDSNSVLLAKAKENTNTLLEDLRELFDAPPPSEKIISKGKEYYDQAKDALLNSWSDSKLAEFLKARQVELPAAPTHEQLVALAETSRQKLVDTKNSVSRFWFDSWSYDDLKNQLEKLQQSTEGSRQVLADRLSSEYENLKDAWAKGKTEGNKQAQEFLESAAKWRDATFDNWSADDLKEYLKGFGPAEPTTTDKLIADAKAKWNYFVYGEPPTAQEQVAAKIKKTAYSIKGVEDSLFGRFVRHVAGYKDRFFNKEEL